MARKRRTFTSKFKAKSVPGLFRELGLYKLVGFELSGFFVMTTCRKIFICASSDYPFTEARSIQTNRAWCP